MKVALFVYIRFQAVFDRLRRINQNIRNIGILD